MLGMRGAHAQRPQVEGEKPFWISYADLMTALMILFLIVMLSSLILMTTKIAAAEQGEKSRASDINTMCKRLQLKAEKLNRDIHVDCKDNRINFGGAGRFGHNDYRLGPEGQQALLQVVPLVIETAGSEEGKKWFKQILIEGFTDTDGSYLYNLHLSLQRSEWVMCTLLDDRSSTKSKFSSNERQQIRELFLTGGVSFNNAKDSKEASRRVELRLQFYGLKDVVPPSRIVTVEAERPEKCLLQ